VPLRLAAPGPGTFPPAGLRVGLFAVRGTLLQSLTQFCSGQSIARATFSPSYSLVTFASARLYLDLRPNDICSLLLGRNLRLRSVISRIPPWLRETFALSRLSHAFQITHQSCAPFHPPRGPRSIVRPRFFRLPFFPATADFTTPPHSTAHTRQRNRATLHPPNIAVGRSSVGKISRLPRHSDSPIHSLIQSFRPSSSVLPHKFSCIYNSPIF